MQPSLSQPVRFGWRSGEMSRLLVLPQVSLTKHQRTTTMRVRGSSACIISEQRVGLLWTACLAGNQHIHQPGPQTDMLQAQLLLHQSESEIRKG